MALQRPRSSARTRPAITGLLSVAAYSAKLPIFVDSSAAGTRPMKTPPILGKPGIQDLTTRDYLGRAVATVRSRPDGSVHWLPAAAPPAGLYLARSADGSQTVRLLRRAVQ
jgi:hypothetical protein